MDNADVVAIDRRTLLRGVAGTAVVAVGGAAATGTGAAQDTQEIVVGPEADQFSFSPADVTIAPGTTVTFVWEMDNHNVILESRPDEANWEGHAEVANAGSEYSHTFEFEGTYESRCDPARRGCPVRSRSPRVPSTMAAGEDDPPTIAAVATRRPTIEPRPMRAPRLQY